jgi:hypothetical protein
LSISIATETIVEIFTRDRFDDAAIKTIELNQFFFPILTDPVHKDLAAATTKIGEIVATINTRKKSIEDVRLVRGKNGVFFLDSSTSSSYSIF